MNFDSGQEREDLDKIRQREGIVLVYPIIKFWISTDFIALFHVHLSLVFFLLSFLQTKRIHYDLVTSGISFFIGTHNHAICCTIFFFKNVFFFCAIKGYMGYRTIFSDSFAT
ncbi:hypothetical protein ACJX0J_032501, partial [Zea mays]